MKKLSSAFLPYIALSSMNNFDDDMSEFLPNSHPVTRRKSKLTKKQKKLRLKAKKARKARRKNR